MSYINSFAEGSSNYETCNCIEIQVLSKTEELTQFSPERTAAYLQTSRHRTGFPNNRKALKLLAEIGSYVNPPKN